ncbi:hypothetical protein K4K49_002354 [Colletotrichum sp. SAR 10_70]|nr:hypothetical protein K4K50_001884 [Colletotrichum sp. SAR 10_71]KAI8176611.1 hypothetical protein K4K49_002354 [Colletotrichum sp. SAR 10_70]KAI8224225.1 hypothetical protein K4K54_005486 [Colletotrichum sp. SAR 10_86]KAI8258523.1 hypothetical protein K4K53_004480 [Colletotrichum sp. SAR 10_77]
MALLSKLAPFLLSVVVLWAVALSIRRGATFAPVDDDDDRYSASANVEASLPVSDYQSSYGNGRSKQQETLQSSLTQAAFQAQWLENDLGGPFDGSRIFELCNKTTWRDDIVLHMRHSRGGLGNVRGTILDFLYEAMLFGVHIVMPSYVKRTDANLDWMDESNGYYDYDNLFDKGWFLRQMGEHCPQMKIYPTPEDAPVKATLKGEYTAPGARSDKSPDKTEEGVRVSLDAWLKSQEDYVENTPSLMPITAGFLGFDFYAKPGLRTALGRLVRVTPAVRELAAEAMWTMRERFDLTATLDPREQIPRGAYCGVHLRTEDDAARSGWLKAEAGFDGQTDWHIATCGGLGLRVIYVATGEKKDIERFAVKAKEKAGIIVVGKNDLLDEPALATALGNMSWDQQGALDYEVLARSSYFSGPSMSSFSWSLAIRRHFNSEGDGSAKWMNPYAINEDEPRVTYDDGLSRIILKAARVDGLEANAPRGMFP